MAGAAVGALLVAAACSSPPTRSSVPVADDWTPEAGEDPLTGATSPSAPPETTEEAITEEAASNAGSAQSGGLIAAAGPIGLRLLQPSGDIVGELAADRIVTQPTWSRDGLRLAATFIDPGDGGAQVAVVDIASGDVAIRDARRAYFFYTWNHDGTRLAALGPGSQGGTAMDILDRTGTPTSPYMLQGGSIYIAWEPRGSRLLVHGGSQLLLVSDPDSPGDQQDLGTVGFDFLAPAWVPGTQDILYVDSFQESTGDESSEAPSLGNGSDAGPRLVRRSLDSGEIVDLGPAAGLFAVAVHPEGDRAAVSLVGPEPPASTESPGSPETASLRQTADLPTAAQAQTENPIGSVQIVDLAATERTTILDRAGYWLEWSPDGNRLLIAVAASQDAGNPGLAWHVWDGDQPVELARFAPSPAFLSNYLRFADQYNETPRLWSPESDAITFGAATADGAVTAVVRLDGVGGVTSLGPSDVSFWSPTSDASPVSQAG